MTKFKKMIKRGKWLEDFLTLKITDRKAEELRKNFEIMYNTKVPCTVQFDDVKLLNKVMDIFEVLEGRKVDAFYTNAMCTRAVRLIAAYNGLHRNHILYTKGKIDWISVFTGEMPILDTMVATVLFDFLKFGGADYWCYCERCKLFSIVERKGQKKFCSDLCRNNARRE